MAVEQKGAATKWQTPPSQAIIEAVADAEDVDVFDVVHPAYDPLYTVVDPEALDALFDGETADLQVDLTYAGYDVTVRNGGRVTLTSSEPAETVRE